MSKGQDKKEIMPNFLKDLNTEILEQLTAGSSEKNVVGLAGDVKELKAVEDICGLHWVQLQRAVPESLRLCNEQSSRRLHGGKN